MRQDALEATYQGHEIIYIDQKRDVQPVDGTDPAKIDAMLEKVTESGVSQATLQLHPPKPDNSQTTEKALNEFKNLVFDWKRGEVEKSDVEAVASFLVSLSPDLEPTLKQIASLELPSKRKVSL